MVYTLKKGKITEITRQKEAQTKHVCFPWLQRSLNIIFHTCYDSKTKRWVNWNIKSIWDTMNGKVTYFSCLRINGLWNISIFFSYWITTRLNENATLFNGYLNIFLLWKFKKNICSFKSPLKGLSNEKNQNSLALFV